MTVCTSMCAGRWEVMFCIFRFEKTVNVGLSARQFISCFMEHAMAILSGIPVNFHSLEFSNIMEKCGHKTLSKF